MFWLIPIAAVGYFLFGTSAGQSLTGAWRKKIAGLVIHSPLGQTATLAASTYASGPALGPAKALYTFLKKNGNGQNPNLAALVVAFQSASNADSVSNHLVGTLTSAGVYDAATSAALTVYTHDPLPPSPGAPAAPPPSQAVIMNPLIPGAAASSGFNLYTWLKGNPKPWSGPVYTQLVQQFQTDVNTDPKFAGPASADGLPKVITSPIPVTGVYDADTSSALTVVSSDPISA
jgi:hypothetical protein